MSKEKKVIDLTKVKWNLTEEEHKERIERQFKQAKRRSLSQLARDFWDNLEEKLTR